MCGIASIAMTATSCINARAVARALLTDIASRGREATGYAYFTPEGAIEENNAPVSAEKFVASRDYRLDAAARNVILHTRLATKGARENPLNNHPVLAYTEDAFATVAAVHNGCIWNDDETFAAHKLTRYGQVDSEVIPAMIARYGSEAYSEIFGEIEGSLATIWLDQREPDVLHAVRAADSPLFLAWLNGAVDSLGLVQTGVLLASTVSALTAALAVIGLTWETEGVSHFEIGEGERITVRAGVWDGLVWPFTLPKISYGMWWGASSRAAKMYGWDSEEDYVSASAYNGIGTGKGKSKVYKVGDSTDNGIGSGKVGTGKPSAKSNEVVHMRRSDDGSLASVNTVADLAEWTGKGRTLAEVLDNLPDTPAALSNTEGLNDEVQGALAAMEAQRASWRTPDAVAPYELGAVASLAARITRGDYTPTAEEAALITKVALAHSDCSPVECTFGSDYCPQAHLAGADLVAEVAALLPQRVSVSV